jgi:hypothetical protein
VRAYIAFVLAILAVVALVLPVAAADKPPTTSWELLTLPATSQAGVQSIATEQGGGLLWVMAGNAVYTWDGKEFAEPNDELKSGMYLAQFYG